MIEEVEKLTTDTTDKELGTTITEENKDEEHFPRTSRVGRVIRRPNRLVETNTAAVNAEDVSGYLKMIRGVNENEFEKEEFCAVGAGIGGGFTHTTELKVLKFDEAVNGPDKENWYKAIAEEHERFVKNGCFEEVPVKDVKPGTKIITSTWAMKKKASGRYRARLNARGFEQQEGVHYDPEQISSPVTNDATIRIVLVLMIMAD